MLHLAVLGGVLCGSAGMPLPWGLCCALIGWC